MDEIPGIMWAFVGGIVGLISLFLGFLRPVPYNGFFKLMFVVGIAMFVYGYIFKIKMHEQSTREILEDRRQKNTNMRQDMETDIDIDDFRNNAMKRQEALRRGYPSTAPRQDKAELYKNPGGNYQNNSALPQNRPQPNYQQPGGSQQFSQPAQQRPAQQGRFCGSCGTPLLKEHKYCPICGGRV